MWSVVVMKVFRNDPTSQLQTLQTEQFTNSDFACLPCLGLTIDPVLNLRKLDLLRQVRRHHNLHTMQTTMRSATVASTVRPTAQRVNVVPNKAACSLGRRQHSSWREGLILPQQQRSQLVTSATFFDERVSSGLITAGSPVISPRYD